MRYLVGAEGMQGKPFFTRMLRLLPRREFAMSTLPNLGEPEFAMSTLPNLGEPHTNERA
jgi:hypothetical protein